MAVSRGWPLGGLGSDSSCSCDDYEKTGAGLGAEIGSLGVVIHSGFCELLQL